MGYQAKVKRARRWLLRGVRKPPERDRAIVARVEAKLARKGGRS